MEHTVKPQEVIEVLKEAMAFVKIIQKYRYSPGLFKCSFDDLVDVFDTNTLISQIELLLVDFGEIFDIGIGG